MSECVELVAASTDLLSAWYMLLFGAHVVRITAAIPTLLAEIFARVIIALVIIRKPGCVFCNR